MKDCKNISSTKHLFLNGKNLTTNILRGAIKNNLKIKISAETETKITSSAELLNKLIADNNIIYGVNTGMGGFVNWLIPGEYAQKLQENLLSAVSTNVGAYLDDEIVKASMITRLNSLANGVSAISLENFKKLIEIYNAGIIPCIPCKGSLGASGDLGPLACIALVAIGKWKAKYKGKILEGSAALKAARIEPMQLSYKEGLCLINGTSVMTGLAALLVERAIDLVRTYDLISCLSFEGLAVKKKPFHPTVHRQKQHSGQLKTAQNIWNILTDSKMIIDEDVIGKKLKKNQKKQPSQGDLPIEDAYSIRCTPHVIGPIRENLISIRDTVNKELNSASDNPLIIPEADDFFHNGHFHGQYIAMAMDHLAISLTTLSNLSDRRIDRFMDQHNSNSLPAFLCLENPGLRFGLMGGQFMATSVTAENRSLCVPLSIQTLTSTGDFQDIVSLGLIAARRASEIYENTVYILAFELMCAAQAAQIRGENKLSSTTSKTFKSIRNIVPYLSEDEYLTNHLENLAQLIKSGKLLLEAEGVIGEIGL